MRVTQNILFQQALDGVQRQTETLALRQAQISSGKRWTRASEDPSAAAEALSLRSRGAVLERILAGIVHARERLDSAASAIQSVSGLLAEAKEIATNAGNPALTQSDRDTLATKLDHLIGQVVESANRRDAFGFLFSGTAADTAPYAFVGGAVVYRGAATVQKVASGDAAFLETGIPGRAIFERERRATTLYFGGSTGVRAGLGADSARDRGTLTITHGATVLGDGALAGGDSVSGVRLGASSAALDTILGPAGAHALEIDAAAGTVRLNGGPAVAFTGSETDLAVSDGAGGVVHLDLTSLQAGFTGTVSIASFGFLSTDGGATQTAIDFSANQTLVNSLDRSTTNVDTTGVRRTGTEVVDYAGTSTLFQALAGLRDDLRGYSALPEAVRDASLAARTREVSRNLENVLSALAELGSRSASASGAEARLRELGDDTTKGLSRLQDADFAEVVVDYNKAQMILELAQAAGSRLLQINYLAFLR